MRDMAAIEVDMEVGMVKERDMVVVWVRVWVVVCGLVGYICCTENLVLLAGEKGLGVIRERVSGAVWGGEAVRLEKREGRRFLVER